VRSITTISFDGDATLWDFDKVMRHSLSVARAELRRRVPMPACSALTIEKMIEIRNGVAADLQGVTVDLEEVRLQAFRRTLAYVGHTDEALAEELNARYLRHRFEDIELYSDVVPALDALGSGYPLGLLSNGNGYPDRCGLPDRFGFVVFAQDVGVAKPDPAMFHEACRQAGCAPDVLVHVGDSLRTDVAGSNGVGAVSVWLNREGCESVADAQPHHEIRSLAELPDVVRECGTGATQAGSAATRRRRGLRFPAPRRRGRRSRRPVHPRPRTHPPAGGASA